MGDLILGVILQYVVSACFQLFLMVGKWLLLMFTRTHTHFRI